MVHNNDDSLDHYIDHRTDLKSDQCGKPKTDGSSAHHTDDSFDQCSDHCIDPKSGHCGEEKSNRSLLLHSHATSDFVMPFIVQF